MKVKTILAWVLLVIAAACIFYGAMNKWEILKADAANDFLPTVPPKLVDIREFEAIKLFGGTGITHYTDSYPQQNKYTGVCFA